MIFIHIYSKFKTGIVKVYGDFLNNCFLVNSDSVCYNNATMHLLCEVHVIEYSEYNQGHSPYMRKSAVAYTSKIKGENPAFFFSTV